MVDHEPSDRLLPIANVGRIMKQILPPSAKISKGAKETMQECVTEFIGFVTVEASDKCHKENRKTVNGDDICWALSTLGFDNYGEAITQYLHKYREFEREKASQNKAEGLEDDGGGGGGGDGDGILFLGNNSIINDTNQEVIRDDDEAIEFGKDDENEVHSLEFRIIDPKGKSPFIRNNP